MATNISKVRIHASAQKVWDVLTQPAMVKLWQYGSKLQTSWEPGTGIRFVTEWQGKTFEQWGTVIAFSPTTTLHYSLFAPRPGIEDKPENYFEMIYTLTPDDEGTMLEIVQIDNRPGAVQEEEQGDENPVLKALKELAESL